MLLQSIYKNAHTRIAKDGNEGLISMDRFNSMLPAWNLEFINKKLEENFRFTPEGQAIPNNAFAMKIISPLTRTYAVTGIAEGSDKYFDISTTHINTSYPDMYFLGANTTTEYNGQIRDLELISDWEFRRRRANMLSKPFSEYPVLCYRAGLYYCYPSDIPAITFSYIKVPTDPFLDYYMDANYDMKFMTAATTYTMTTGLQYRDGTVGTPSGVLIYYSQAAATQAGSTLYNRTTELEIPSSMHTEFQEYIIESLQSMLGDLQGQQLTLAKRQMDKQV